MTKSLSPVNPPQKGKVLPLPLMRSRTAMKKPRPIPSRFPRPEEEKERPGEELRPTPWRKFPFFVMISPV